MFDYLVKSSTRRRMLKLIWRDELQGSVAELARRADVSYAGAHRELTNMQEAGLAQCTRVGNVVVFSANHRHDRAALIRELVWDRPPSLRSPRGVDHAPPEPGSNDDARVRSWLCEYGAPLLRSGGDDGPSGREPLPSPEEVIAAGAHLAHRDAEVARALPVCIWRVRSAMDADRLLAEARRLDEVRVVGFLLDMTAALAGDPELRRWAGRFQDRRVTQVRDFFQAGRSKYARQLAARNTPSIAERWKLRMNLGMDSFESLFRKFVS